MNDNKDRNVLCYVAVDDMGNVLGAVVHEDENRQSTAVWLADWIMYGLHVMPMSVEDVRVNFGREFEGPNTKPTPPYHVRVVTRNEKGGLVLECEGNEDLQEEIQTEDDFDEPDYDKESYAEIERRAKLDEKEKAFDILQTLCYGKDDWKRLRTLGDFDTLRHEIAGGFR